MTQVKLGPQTPEEAQASVRELITMLDAQIQAETEKFMDQREHILADRPESFEGQERQLDQLRDLTWRFERRLLPIRRQREHMVNTIVRVIETQPLQFYYELLPQQAT